ncbi:MAG: GNAT family N-acetyltransferase [Alphaproteobacteria bacterium]|nr:GNAT family N-acetyltransferase [Alphaproteobacteria bacterium]
MHVSTITESNLHLHPQVICFINPKHPAYHLKIDWLKERFREGMVIKLLYLEDKKRPAGFIEYVPGDQCWRGVHAPGYLFIHCIWISASKDKKRGYGSMLVKDCISEAEKGGLNGVAAMVSESSFMADRTLFMKNGFRIAMSDKPYDLVVRTFRENVQDPVFTDWRSQLSKYQGLHILWSKQCPWVARFVEEIRDKLIVLYPGVTFTEMKTPAEAQQAPSPYAVFNLVYNGRLLADHYISETRLMNILKKEKLISS